MGIFDRLFRRRRSGPVTDTASPTYIAHAGSTGARGEDEGRGQGRGEERGEGGREERGEGGREEAGPADQDIQVDESSATDSRRLRRWR